MGSEQDWSKIGARMPRPGKFVLVNSKDDLRLLRRILSRPDFPHNADVFTHELSLTGARVGRLTDREIRHREFSRARRLRKSLAPFMRIAREKNLRIWLGHGLIENRQIYNAYSLVDKTGIIFTHRKKFLWRTERGLFAKSPDWRGNFRNCSILICSEATAFFDPLFWQKPTNIPELRKANPKIVAVPAHWWFRRKYLERISRTIATPYHAKNYGKLFVEKGVNKRGVPVFIAHSMYCKVIGPAANPKPKKKTAVYVSLKKPGWIAVTRNSIEATCVER